MNRRAPVRRSDAPFAIVALEPRLLMSGGTAAAAMVSQPAPAVVHAKKAAQSSPTLADRQLLLKNWVGTGANTLAASLAAGDTAGFDQQLLSYMTSRSGPHYFFDSSEVDGDVAFANSNMPQQVSTIIATANQVLSGLFPEQVNSSTYTVQLPANFSWVTQPTSTKNSGFLHSLNRMSWLPTLAMAYRFTGNAAYANEVIREMTTWAQQNPPLSKPDDWGKQAISWQLLDTASRVDNWICAYEMLVGTSAWTAPANTVFLKEMLLHGDFLSRVTPRALTNNWTITHAGALTEIGMLFPELKAGAAWKAQGQTLLFNAMAAQLYPDGGQAEESPGYLGDVIQGIMDPYLLAADNGITWPKGPRRLIANSVTSYFQLLQPDGTQPAIGDTYRTTGTVTVSHAAQILNETSWPLTRTRVRDVFHLGTAEASQTLGASITPTLTGRGTDFVMPYSGYWITRSGEDRSARQLILDAGPTGMTAHGHYDLLGFELYGYGRALIAEPGEYIYDDSKSRKYVLSTPAHNTISVDGVSHAEVEGVGNKNIIVDDYQAPGDHVQWTAHHTAYAGLKGSPVVARSVWFNRNDTMVIVDYGQSSTSHTYTSSFNLPGSTSKVVNGSIHSADPGGANVLIVSVPVKGQTTTAASSFVSSQPAPNATDRAVRYAVSQKGTSVMIANMVITYTGSTPPAVTASWSAVPRRGRAGIIKITRDGVDQFVSFQPPTLTGKKATKSVARAATPATALARPAASIFSATVIAHRQQDVLT